MFTLNSTSGFCLWQYVLLSLCKPADGYISNTCVDIDYEAVKRKVLQSKKIDTSPLPPPPPDPPHMLDTDSSNRDRYSRPGSSSCMEIFSCYIERKTPKHTSTHNSTVFPEWFLL